jgi:lipopolysaccharide transport system permease protein/teichoic acid transport system permease protein
MVVQTVELSRGFFGYLRELLRSRRLIFELTRREFRGRYLGSIFGLVWAFIHPGMMMLIYWIVFQYGMHSGPIDQVPFVVWLLSGLIPWFFISEAISGGSMTVLDNRFLVKKVVFRVSLLPVVRLLTVLPVHLFFLTVIFFLAWGYGYAPTAYCLQLPYYMGAALVLGIGLSLLTSALVPFFRDLQQVIMVILQIVFWLMPIVWPYPKAWRYRWTLMLDPLYYIINGYRESLVPEHHWFWREHAMATIYYWTVTILVLIVGGVVFRRLKPHFADVV